MTDSRHLMISVVETLADSVAGYAHIGEHAHGFRLYAYCEHQALVRERSFRDLLQQMRDHGWREPVHGTVLGSAHRLFVDLKAALAHNESAIITELHRGESFLLAKIETALAEGRFDRPIEAALRQIAAEVRETVAELAQHNKPGHNDPITRPAGG